MKLNLHGALRAQLGPSIEIHADSVAEAIRGASVQTNWPADMLIDVVGFDTEEKLSAKTDVEEIDLVPSVYGGGGKFGKILVGAALIGLAFTGVGGLLGGAMKTALISMGVGLAMQGVMQIFMKTPKIDRANDPDASKYLGLNKNTTAIGTPIKLGWGRTNMYPHYLSVQSDSNKLVHAVFPASYT